MEPRHRRRLWRERRLARRGQGRRPALAWYNRAVMLIGVVVLIAVAIAACAGVAVALLLRRAAVGPTLVVSALADLKSIGEKVDQLAEIRTRLEVGDAAQRDVKERLEKTYQTLEALRVQAEERRKAQEDTLAVTRRIEGVFYGSHSKGKAGESVLAEALRALPPDMLARDVNVHGKVVEFGLVLANNRVCPIDSKWPGSDLLLRVDEATDEGERARLCREIEKEVERRVREVAQYIDPAQTTPWAIAAVPDAALSVCTTVYAEAHRRGVLLMSYSMCLPYLLAVYRLHMQYAQSIDLENLKVRLGDFGRSLDEIDAILDNRMQRAGVMVQNAYNECKNLLAKMRGSLTALVQQQAIEEGGNMALPQPPPGDTVMLEGKEHPIHHRRMGGAPGFDDVRYW